MPSGSTSRKSVDDNSVPKTGSLLSRLGQRSTVKVLVPPLKRGSPFSNEMLDPNSCKYKLTWPNESRLHSGSLRTRHEQSREHLGSVF